MAQRAILGRGTNWQQCQCEHEHWPSVLASNNSTYIHAESNLKHRVSMEMRVARDSRVLLNATTVPSDTAGLRQDWPHSHPNLLTHPSIRLSSHVLLLRKDTPWCSHDQRQAFLARRHLIPFVEGEWLADGGNDERFPSRR